MKYEFPQIKNIEDVLPAIKDREEIVVAERPEFTVVNYLVAFTDSFPDPNTASSDEESVQWAIRRECRGLKFNSSTGDILARPYHKFFNLNEKEETQHNAVDWNDPFVILDKMDGSMIHPVITRDNKIHSCTRMGMTDVAEQADAFIASSSIDYLTFCRDMLECGMTPIFEWCSKKQRIVLLYREDRLVLTAIRYNYSGNYMHHTMLNRNAEEYGIPVVDKYDGTFDDIERYLEDTKDNTEEEGNVFRFDSGAMLKCKNDWYVQIHRAKDQIRFEKDVIRMFLEGSMDDVLPHVLAEDKERLTAYTEGLTKGIEDAVENIHGYIDDINERVKDVEEKFKRREMAAIIKTEYGQPISALLFSALSGKNVTELVVNKILDKTNSSTQVDSVRILFRVDWDDY